MKEKRNYKRFELIPFLAILGCAGMFLFEGYFILERYDHAVAQSEVPLPAVEAPVAAPAISAPNAAPVLTNPSPAGIESAPARREPAEPAEPVKPAVVPVG